jgi:ATP-dependent helicase/nuclease subunit A
MAAFEPTPSQRAAIETKGGAILVSAAAGSGKTKVLTERLMARIMDRDDPRDLDSFLVITFTKAAASELRSRIMDELGEAAAAQPDNRRLRRQSALVGRAEIGTIHAFCQDILRENCHLAGLSPDFRVADDQRAAAMRETVLDRVMDERYEHMEKYPDFGLLADTVGSGRDDGRLAALVMGLHDKMQCHARPEKWAAEQIAELELGERADAADTPWGRELMDAARDTAEYWAGEMEALSRLMSEGCEAVRASYGGSVAETADALRRFAGALNGGWDRARELAEIPFPRLGSLRDSPDPELSEYVKARREACKKACGALAEKFADPSAALMDDMRRTAPAMRALFSLALDFDRAYSAEKRRRALVDFSDLEHCAARLLTNEDGSPTALAGEISRRYTEIMVDEYQDVSEVQDAIFRAVSRDGQNLFMVGDVKQAIYRFRLADPAIFIDKYDSYADADKALPGQGRRIFLRENFRSRREIIDGANRVFACCMSRKLGETEYDGNAALRCGASYGGSVPAPELMLIDTLGADDENPDRVKIEARAAADKIAELMDSGVTVSEDGAQRPLRWGDIAILLRSANAVGGEYRKALIERGIPAQSGQGGGFFTSIEVSCAMSVLAVADNPHQDVPLIAALRSPAFGFTPDELSEVRAADRDGDFYTALCKAAEGNEKCAGFLRKLGEFRALAPDMGLCGFLWRIYNDLDLMALCSAMTDGETRRRNLMLLLGCAKQFESSGYRGLRRFNLWLARMAGRGEEPEGAAGDADAVRIMSVHKSKGLEFPVVLLCDTSRRFNRQDSRDTVLVHPKLGLGPKVTDLESRIEYPTLARLAIKERGEREMLSEEMRLLYVALTRARERLIITAAMPDPQTQIDKLAPAARFPMPAEVLRSCQSPAQWLMYAAMTAEGELTMSVSSPGGRDAGSEGEAERPEPDEAARTELIRRLSFEYPHHAAETLPSKVTATELKAGAFEPDAEGAPIAAFQRTDFREPVFRHGETKLAAAAKGTAVHAVLEHMDFAAAYKDGARSEVERLRAAGILSDEEAASVDAAAVDGLLRSDIGSRLLAAAKLNREFRFSVLLPAEEFFPGGDGEEVLLQGAVDCWFQEDGGVVIVDYKSDRVTAEEVPERAALYAPQIRAYALAMAAVTGKKVRETVLYFLRPGIAFSDGKNP